MSGERRDPGLSRLKKEMVEKVNIRVRLGSWLGNLKRECSR